MLARSSSDTCYLLTGHECACARALPRKSVIEMCKTENGTENGMENGTENDGMWKTEWKVAWRLPATVALSCLTLYMILTMHCTVVTTTI